MGRDTGDVWVRAVRYWRRLVVIAAAAGVVLASGFLSPTCACGGTALRTDQHSSGHESRLSTDGPSVTEMVETVRHHARLIPGAQPDASVSVVFTTRLPVSTEQGHAMFGGIHLGDTAFVRTDVGWPERTLVHEVAHLLTRGDEHGPVWRAVYLGSIEELFGATRRAQEERRIAWVYERCYLTDDCPTRAARS